ncbi:MAG: hypothetical protein JJU33_00670 [Phycisphaerales bacterium]|nr:hypothetical protein [Phycisphaerales bacterium]
MGPNTSKHATFAAFSLLGVLFIVALVVSVVQIDRHARAAAQQSPQQLQVRHGHALPGVSSLDPLGAEHRMTIAVFHDDWHWPSEAGQALLESVNAADAEPLSEQISRLGREAMRDPALRDCERAIAARLSGQGIPNTGATTITGAVSANRSRERSTFGTNSQFVQATATATFVGRIDRDYFFDVRIDLGKHVGGDRVRPGGEVFSQPISLRRGERRILVTEFHSEEHGYGAAMVEVALPAP